MTGLPLAARVRNGVRFAEVDALVVHVLGARDVVPTKPHKASPRLVTITLPTGVTPLALTLADCRLDAADPVARFVAWIIEREAMRQRKDAGQAAPLSADSILAVYRFCNVYREHDAVTRWIAANIVEPHRDDPDCWFALAVARFINDTAVLAKILPFLLPFDPDQMRIALEAHGAKWRRAYRAGIAGAGETRIPHLIENIFKPLWQQRETLRWRLRDTLASFAHRLRRPTGMGPFLAAQVVADYKHTELLRSASDWWTFALPGPGSRQGLNRVRGLPAETSWLEPVWCRDLAKLYVEVAPLLEAAGLPRLDLQNLQNCCCEFDKSERAHAGQVRGLRRYLPAPPKVKPKRETKLRQRTAAATTIAEATPQPAEQQATETITATVAAVKFIITRADKAALRARGFSDAQIAELTPQQASDILARQDDWALVERGGKDLLDAGLRAAARGWAIFPCTDGKKPLVKWKEAATTDPTTITAWAAWPRTAMWARALPDDVVVIDLDCKHGNDGMAEFERLQGCHPDQFTAPRVITGSGGRHLYTNPFGRTFKNSVGRIDDKGRLVGIAPGIDTKTRVGYCVIPSGNGRYRWLTDPDTPLPATPIWAEVVLRSAERETPAAPARPYRGASLEAEELLQRARDAIIAAGGGAREITLNNWALILGHSVGGGVLDREPTIEALIDAGKQQGTWNAKKLREKVIRAVNDGMRQPDYGEESLQEANRQAPEQLGELLTGQSSDSAAKATNNGADNDAKEAGKQSYTSEADTSSGPVNLWGHFDPPALPRGLLPTIIEQFAIEEAELMGADPGGLALGALAVCAAALPDHTRLQVKRHDPYWLESARLWVGLIGEPSTKKTPIILRVAKPLKRLDAELFRAFLAAQDLYDSLSSDERKHAERPKQRRLRIEDTTIEAAQEVLKDSPDGVLCIQDELSGWFGAMDKYAGHRGAAKDRGFWLQAFHGGPYAINRIKRGAALIENLSISLLGGIQPEPMRKVAADTVDDGLIQRLIPLVLRPGTIGQDVPAARSTDTYDMLIRQLHTSNAPIAPLQFTDGALAIRKELELKHLDLMRCEAVNKKLAAHIGKYDGLFARLCLLWHAIEAEPAAMIGEHTARRVAEFMHLFLLPHAFAFYGGMLGLSDDHERLTAVAGYILAHKLQRITNRDVQRGDRTMRGLSRPDIERIFQQLDALGWVNRIPGPRLSDPPHWLVNPEVHRLFEQQAAREAAERARARDMLQAMFRKAADK